MNDIQYLIDRQLGINCRFSYDNILKRLVVNEEESFYGLQNTLAADAFEQDRPIFACRFSEAPGYEHILALANEDGRVAIQDTRKKNAVSSLVGFQCHNNAVFDLAWMPGFKNFVTVSGDHTACLWDVSESSPKKLTVYSNHTRSVKTAVFRPTEPSVFATGARDGHILIWDIRTNNTPGLVLKPDCKLVNCHSNYTPKMLKSQSKRPRIDQRAISITGLVFQDDITLLSCAESDGNIKMWDLRKNYSIYTKEPLPKHSISYCGSSTKNGYTNLIIDDARTRLYASCMDNVIYCFNISTYNTLPEQKYIGHENSTFYIKTSLSPDCMYLVSGSSDKNAYIWNVKYSEPIVKLVGHWAEVTCATWCQKGDMKIVTCSDDARHNIWRIGREFPDPEEILKGKAEVIPRTDVANLPKWEMLNKTPSSTKRNLTPLSYSAKRFKAEESSERRTKRCLIDLNAANANIEEFLGKCLKTESNERKLLQAGTKRNSGYVETSPAKKEFLETDQTFSIAGTSTMSHLKTYEKTDHKILSSSPELPKSKISPTKSPNRTPVKVSPTKVRIISFEKKAKKEFLETDQTFSIAGTSTLSHLKTYEKTNHKILSPSPELPKSKISPTKSPNRTPVKVSPTKVRIISFDSPTMDLPNYVLTGEAPHLKLMSPLKKKQHTRNWLTLMIQERKRKGTVDKSPIPTPLSPKDNLPSRRISSTEKTPKSSKKNETLLKYFSVASKKK